MKLNKDKLLFALRIALAALMLGTLVFIFVNSCLPPEQSDEQSAAVGGIISTILPKDTELYRFVTEYLRKIAHFTEYGMLGIEIAVYIMAFAERKRIYILHSVFVPVFVGLLDETIQIFSGRGPAIYDVWIDIGGFWFFSLIAWGTMCLSLYVYKIVSKKLREKREENTNG